MNYKKIYTLYITSFQNSEPRTRLQKTNLPIMVKKSYSKEEKIKYFNGKSPQDFLQEYFNIDFSEKTFNYPDTHSGKGKKKK